MYKSLCNCELLHITQRRVVWSLKWVPSQITIKAGKKCCSTLATESPWNHRIWRWDFLLSCIPTKKSTWKELHQLKEHQGACPIAFLIILSLWVWHLAKSHTSSSGLSEPPSSGQGMGAVVSYRRIQKHCMTLCCKLGCTGSSCLGLLSLSRCLFHRKYVWFLWNFVLAVSTLPSKSTSV